MMSVLTPHTMIRMIWWPPQVRPPDRRCAPGVTVKWWRKRAHRRPTASGFGRRGEGLGDDLDVQRTPDSSCKYLRDDGRTWWDMRKGSNPLCAVGRKTMSVEDNKAAVRRFTQALDSNNLSILPEICTPACADAWSQGINSDPWSDHHIDLNQLVAEGDQVVVVENADALSGPTTASPAAASPSPIRERSSTALRTRKSRRSISTSRILGSSPTSLAPHSSAPPR